METLASHEGPATARSASSIDHEATLATHAAPETERAEHTTACMDDVTVHTGAAEA